MSYISPGALNAVLINSGQPTPGFITLGNTVYTKVLAGYSPNVQSALAAVACPAQQVAFDGTNATLQLL
jgi:hypothetical protein